MHKNNNKATKNNSDEGFITQRGTFHRNISSQLTMDDKLDNIINSISFLKDNSTAIIKKVDELEEGLKNLNGTVEKIQPQINKINEAIPTAIKETIENNNKNIAQFVQEALVKNKECANREVLQKALDNAFKRNKLDKVECNYQI